MDLGQRFLDDIAKEQVGLRKVLDKYIPSDKYPNPRILNICSGIANEEPLLVDRFGEGLDLVSIDNFDYLKTYVKELGRKSVIFGDLRNIENHVQGKFDVIMGRNVPITPLHVLGEGYKKGYWKSIFNSLSRYMKEDSMLFLTLLVEYEFIETQQVLEEVGYNIKIKRKNGIKVHSDKFGVSAQDTKDHYVIVAERPPQLRLF